MKTPDLIYLIDTGEEISWCDDPNPNGEIEPDDVVEYVKSSISKAAPALLETLESIIGGHAMHENYDVKIYITKDQLNNARAAIAAAKGE